MDGSTVGKHQTLECLRPSSQQRSPLAWEPTGQRPRAVAHTLVAWGQSQQSPCSRLGVSGPYQALILHPFLNSPGNYGKNNG